MKIRFHLSIWLTLRDVISIREIKQIFYRQIGNDTLEILLS